MKPCSLRFVVYLPLFLIVTVSTQSFASDPTISPISNQIVQENQSSQPIPFVVGDSTGDLNSLILSGSSSDTSILSDSGIVFGGADSNRTVVLTPAANKFGQVTIVITVTRGISSASDTFAVKVNNPPRFDTNLPLSVLQGDSAAITSANMVAVDNDNTTAQIVYYFGPDTTLGYGPLHGTLLLNHVPIPSGGTFTQDDINNNRLSYNHDGSQTTSDAFGFTIKDADGGIASDNGHTVFRFNIDITHVNQAPTAVDTSYPVARNSTLSGTLHGTDPDSPNLTFSIVTNGSNGNVVINDSTTGQFTYTPDSGFTGPDSFYFQVYDGALYAINPGKISVMVSIASPVVTNGSGVTVENQSLYDTLKAADINIPKLPLQFSIISGGHLGTTTLIDTSLGRFSYSPQNNIFGTDTIVYEVTNGQSGPSRGSFVVTIRALVVAGDLLLTEDGNNNVGTIFVADFAHHAATTLVSGDSVIKPICVVADPAGITYILDQQTGVIRYDPLTQQQTQLDPASSFSSNPVSPRQIALEHNGNLLITDGTAGVKRINPVTGAISAVSSGDSLSLALGIAVDNAGNIFVGDGGTFLGGTSKIVKIDPTNGSQTVIASGNGITVPIGLTTNDSGTVFVADPATFLGKPADLVYSVNPKTGEVRTIQTSDTLKTPVSLDFMPDGHLIICNTHGGFFLTDTSNGQTQILIPEGVIQNPNGVTVVKPRPLFTTSTVSLNFVVDSIGTYKDSIVVRNAGAAPLVIDSITTTNVHFTVSPASGTIAPSSAMAFYITFTPTSADSVVGQILFNHNGYNSPTSISVGGSGLFTGVHSANKGLPKVYALYDNYPNPFNPSTVIPFDIPRQSIVSIGIYNILGQEVARLLEGNVYEAGSYSLNFDASRYASGIYFYRIRATAVHGGASFMNVKKMVLVR